LVDRLTRKWAKAGGQTLATKWVHDSEHDVHYVLVVRESEQLACVAFFGEELKRVHEDRRTIDRLKAKLRDHLQSAQLLPPQEAVSPIGSS
jgi:hypothetical protein